MTLGYSIFRARGLEGSRELCYLFGRDLRGSSGLDAPVDHLRAGVSRQKFSSLAVALWVGRVLHSSGGSGALLRFHASHHHLLLLLLSSRLSLSSPAATSRPTFLSIRLFSLSHALHNSHRKLQSLSSPGRILQRPTMMVNPRTADYMAAGEFTMLGPRSPTCV